ncbi:hypothetical protein [Lapidilactobacillus dextrinicus]|nr:hypothetical protein [Lapidilactobacillus dextrinicus]
MIKVTLKMIDEDAILKLKAQRNGSSAGYRQITDQLHELIF